MSLMMTYYTRRQQTQPITQYSRGPPRSLRQYHADKQPHKSHRDADPRDVYDSQQWLNDARAIRREPGQFRSADLDSAFSGWSWTPRGQCACRAVSASFTSCPRRRGQRRRCAQTASHYRWFQPLRNVLMLAHNSSADTPGDMFVFKHYCYQ